MNEKKFTIDDEVELADIQAVENVLEKKLVYLEQNEPCATNDINKIKTALEVINDLYWDLVE